jgi:NADH-quinone oxidoreductase subunit K
MLQYYVGVAIGLFTIGLIGVLLRRNIVLILLCVELMLNSLNIVFVAAGHYLSAADAYLFVFFILTISAAEVAVGLVLVLSLYRRYDSIDVDQLSELKW